MALMNACLRGAQRTRFDSLLILLLFTGEVSTVDGSTYLFVHVRPSKGSRHPANGADLRSLDVSYPEGCAQPPSVKPAPTIQANCVTGLWAVTHTFASSS